MKKNNDTSNEYIEVWADFVKMKDLLFALTITGACTLIAYFIAPNQEPKPLYFGLVGALLGFIISSIVINPKRKIKTVENGEE